MKRLLLLGASLVLGIFAASRLPAAPMNHAGMNHSLKQHSPDRRTNAPPKTMQFQQGSGLARTKPSLPFESQKKFGSIGDIQQKPFKPFKPVGPIGNHPITKPLNPIKVNPGFPIKPIGVNQPVVKPSPIKPIKPLDPIVKPWPIKPIKPIHQPHHHHCAPHWCKPTYPWMWYGGCGVGNYVVSKPIYVEVPVYVNQVEQLPEVQVGATLTLPGQALGNDAGVAMLRIGDITLGAMVNEWADNGVQLTLPMLGVEQPKRAEIVVMFANGQVVMTVPVKLLPAVPPAQQQ